VIKNHAQPRSCRMARLARLGITGSDVIRYRAAECRGALPRIDVASVTSCRIERVIVVQVTGNAGCRRRRDVHSRQGEPRSAVVERGTRPIRCGVADRAIQWEPCRNMIWHHAPESYGS